MTYNAESPPLLTSSQIERLCEEIGQAEGRIVAAVANAAARVEQAVAEDVPITLRIAVFLLLDPNANEAERNGLKATLKAWVKSQSKG